MQYTSEFAFLQLGIGVIQYTFFGLILILYPPYPAPISLERYFEYRGYKYAGPLNMSMQKKSFASPFPIFFIFTIAPLPMVSNMISVYTSIDLSNFFQLPLLKLIQLFLFLTIILGLIKISLAIIRKKFRLYYAKGCFTLIAEKNDEIQNMAYLSKGLDAYNSYLRRNLNIQINNIKKIESKIATFSFVEKEQAIKKSPTLF